MMDTGKSERQYLIVMRHGLREDEVDSQWLQKADRPWDPPLAARGLGEVEEAAALLQRYNIEKVVCSPFQRCLQTASIVCGTLRPPINTVEVDNSMCEVLGPVYFAGAGGPSNGQSVEDWLWAGEAPEAAWKKGLGSDAIAALDSGSPFPAVPETLPQAHARYAKAIEDAANRADGQNVLIVTHGEGVGKSVTRLLPWASVFAVQHCGFTVTWRDVEADGDCGLWVLENNLPELKKGVFWRDRSC